MKNLYATLILLSPSMAFAKGANHSPGEMFAFVVGSVFLAFVLYGVTEAMRQTPEQKTEILESGIKKLPEGKVQVTYFNQSGNVRSAYVFNSAEHALHHITTTFNRSTIKGDYNVRTDSKGNIHFDRLYHHHRGTKEGKVLQGCIMSAST